MTSLRRILSSLLGSAVGIAVMVVIATVVFFITVIVVSVGASLAGIEPSDDFVVLSASLVVVAVILTGGFSPRMAREEPDEMTSGEDDPAYN